MDGRGLTGVLSGSTGRLRAPVSGLMPMRKKRISEWKNTGENYAG
ncbi:hypothetical protein [Ruminococcus sp.]|nr:hypothetical protein [Ruminococcus sp.]